MFIEIGRFVVLGFSSFGFYSFLMALEKHYGKKTALIVTLIFGALAILGLILHPILKM